jgi:hypothetical protein
VSLIHRNSSRAPRERSGRDGRRDVSTNVMPFPSPWAYRGVPRARLTARRPSLPVRSDVDVVCLGNLICQQREWKTVTTDRPFDRVRDWRQIRTQLCRPVKTHHPRRRRSPDSRNRATRKHLQARTGRASGMSSECDMLLERCLFPGLFIDCSWSAQARPSRPPPRSREDRRVSSNSAISPRAV